MIESEAVQVIASLFGCWFLGWGSAFIFKVIKDFLEKI